MRFIEKLERAASQRQSLVCIGLDSAANRIPNSLRQEKQPQFVFNRAIIDATADLVLAYKLQCAYYEARGADGVAELKATCDYLRHCHPDVPIILDAKRGDIGSSNEAYLEFVFEYLGADAVTVHPYLGRESLQGFLACEDKGIIVLCRTSNPGAGELQNLPIGDRPLYVEIARRVNECWNSRNNCLLVVSATCPGEMALLRGMIPKMWFLAPGVGWQGGPLEAALAAGLRPDKSGLIINSSRDIIFASAGDDFALAARFKTLALRNRINKVRRQ